MTQPQTETVFTPIEAKDITEKHITEALAFAERHDRNLARRNGNDAIPVPAYQLRLFALVVKHLAGKHLKKVEKPELVQKPARPKVAKKQSSERQKTGGASFDNGAPVKENALPPLTDAQQEAYMAACSILGLKRVVTSRGVAEVCKWGSHNTAARHLRTLVDLGYLRKAGKTGVLVVA